MSDKETTAIDDGRAALERWILAAPANYFDADPFLRSVLERLLGDGLGEAIPHLREVGATAAGPMHDLAARCGADANLPHVESCDTIGRPREEVVFDPCYHELGRLFWASRILAVLEEPGREVLAGAIAYLMDHNGEAGHACPVACTAGAVKLLQRLGTPDQQRRYLPALLSPDYDQCLRAAQFVTEVQGGSDVGANACVAEEDPDIPGRFRISGEKWFCSVADAGLFVVSARRAGAPGGTRGLGLFLVPRTVNGRPNGFTLRRLKDKLGSRAMATGEIDFHGALGEAIGLPDDGFRNLVSIVLDTSRVHNAISSAAAMRRAFVDAHTYANHRRAFGAEIAAFPAVREILARMKLHTMAGVATTFRILAISDRLDTGETSEQLRHARRIDVMLNKYWTAIHASRTARDGIEILGGNGTIEDFSVMPRLYRDAMVMESWEGTHNTLVAQVLRDVVSRRLHEPWLAVRRTELDELVNEPAFATVADAFDRVESLLRRAADADGPERERFRHVVDRMCRVADSLALHAQARWEREHGTDTGAAPAAELYAVLHLQGAEPLTTPRVTELEGELAARL